MTETESFERAFVAMSTLLGQRDAASSGLARPTRAAVLAAARLAEGDRHERAHRLAAELRPIAAALEARRFR